MKKLLLVGILHGLLCPLALMAQTVTITYHGTSTVDTYDYYDTQAVTFSFVINDNAPYIIYDDYGSTAWREDKTSPSLYAGISGTGLSGTFVKPDGDDYFQNQTEVVSGESGSISTRVVYTSTSSSIGINAYGNPIYSMYFGAVIPDLSWGESGRPATEVSAYLSSHAGTYDATGSSYFFTNDEGIYFTISSVTIATTAVPEPSTYAALVGLLALGFVAVRRRHRG